MHVVKILIKIITITQLFLKGFPSFYIFENFWEQKVSKNFSFCYNFAFT